MRRKFATEFKLPILAVSALAVSFGVFPAASSFGAEAESSDQAACLVSMAPSKDSNVLACSSSGDRGAVGQQYSPWAGFSRG